MQNKNNNQYRSTYFLTSQLSLSDEEKCTCKNFFDMLFDDSPLGSYLIEAIEKKPIDFRALKAKVYPSCRSLLDNPSHRVGLIVLDFAESIVKLIKIRESYTSVWRWLENYLSSRQFKRSNGEMMSLSNFTPTQRGNLSAAIVYAFKAASDWNYIWSRAQTAIMEPTHNNTSSSLSPSST